MTVLPWPGSSALQRAKAMHPAAGARTALGPAMGPMPAASTLEDEDAEHFDDTGGTDEACPTGAPPLWRVDGGAAR